MGRIRLLLLMWNIIWVHLNPSSPIEFSKYPGDKYLLVVSEIQFKIVVEKAKVTFTLCNKKLEKKRFKLWLNREMKTNRENGEDREREEFKI